jgi:hypothetical protein
MLEWSLKYNVGKCRMDLSGKRHGLGNDLNNSGNEISGEVRRGYLFISSIVIVFKTSHH